MKNAEGAAHPFELLDRRLKQSTDQLRDVRETLEELGRSASTLQRLFGVEQIREAARGTGQGGKGHTATQPPPSRSGRPSQGSTPSSTASQDDIPEWRKVFPDLSNKVPGRGK
ncbi:hypothetical protein NR798_15405 [Archangium gephyra]|uniref:hypothetical protein n=1 Tax=Archangium gephyra TaxID=48 RepID=UPI0035D43AC5